MLIGIGFFVMAVLTAFFAGLAAHDGRHGAALVGALLTVYWSWRLKEWVFP